MTAGVRAPGQAGTETGTGAAEGFAWAWRSDGAERGDIPPDTPLPTLLAVASRLMGGYWWRMAQTVSVSPPGLGVLRMLLASDGLKPSEVAAIGHWTPGTVTSLTDTLVRDGYLERRKDDRDRRVVRLHLTEAGRTKTREALDIMAPAWSQAFDFIDEADEPVIRKFLVDTIARFAELARDRGTPSDEGKPGN